MPRAAHIRPGDGMLTLDLHHCLADDAATVDGARLLAALRRLPNGALPLQAACTQGGIVDDRSLGISLLGSHATPTHVVARIGVFFAELVGGCSCHDDPAASPAYAELRVEIARADGRAAIAVVSEADAAAV